MQWHARTSKSILFTHHTYTFAKQINVLLVTRNYKKKNICFQSDSFKTVY